MGRIVLWEREKVIQRMKGSLLLPERRPRIYVENDFPLSDILLAFYKDAEINSDICTEESLHTLHGEYCLGHPGFSLSIEKMVEEGWISLILGRWESAMDPYHPIEEEELAGHRDREALEFLAWLLKKKQNTGAIIRVRQPEKKLECFQQLYPDTPGLQWFLDKSYLVEKNQQYYAWNPFSYSDAINCALAKLWLHMGKENFGGWLTIAREIKGTYHLMEYLEEKDRYILLEQMIQKCLCRYGIPSPEMEEEFYKKHYFLQYDHKKLNETGKWHVLSGNRALDFGIYDHIIFEWQRALYTRQEDYALLLGSALEYCSLLPEQQMKKLCPILNAFDRLDAYYWLGEPGAENILELCCYTETQFLGFRFLLRDRYEWKEQMEAYRSCYLQVAKKILEQEAGRPQTEEMADLMLYLADQALPKKGGGGIDWKILEGLIDLLGEEPYLSYISGEIAGYFENLLRLENDINWTRGYSLLLLCMNRWFQRKEDWRETAACAEMEKVVCKGYLQLLEDGKHYARYLELELFEADVWRDIYRRHIAGQMQYVQRNYWRLPPAGKEAGKNNILHYQYKIVLSILFSIYEGSEQPEAGVKQALLECMEQVFQRNSQVFDYSAVRIFDSEKIVQRCIAIIDGNAAEYQPLIEEMLNAEVPGLLLYYNAAKDKKLREKLKEAICRNVTEDCLKVFDNERAFDLVMNNQIECLYAVVEKQLECQLEIWDKRGIGKNDPHVSKAVHQKWRLLYEQGRYQEILEGDSLFFQAVVYMEIEGYKDYKKAGDIWKRMLDDRSQRCYASAVYLNYMILLNRELEELCKKQEGEQEALEGTPGEENAEEPETDDRKRRASIVRQFEQLAAVIEAEEIDKWQKDEQETYCSLVIRNKMLCGQEIADSLYTYNSRYHLQLSIRDYQTDCVDAAKGKLESEKAAYTDREMTDMLCRFYRMERNRKSQIYYSCKGIPVQDEMWYVFLMDTILQTCFALQGYGPQLTEVRSEKGKTQYTLPEDLVSQLFREMYNLAFGDAFGLSIHDQEKRASTGAVQFGRQSSAEIDLDIYDDRSKRTAVLEAFVLDDGTRYDIFRDHVGKVIGNNTEHFPLSFMLVYGKAEDMDKAYRRYMTYLSKKLQPYLEQMKIMIEKTEICNVEEAFYYEGSIVKQYTDAGIRLIRQRVVYQGGQSQEILHIIMDVSKLGDAGVRRALKR